MSTTFYKGSKAAIIVFSLEQNEHGKKSFERVTEWHEDIKKYTGELPIVLFGNKVDLVNEDDLYDEEVHKIAKEQNFLGYYKTSAKTGNGVFAAFQAIIKNLYNKYKKE